MEDTAKRARDAWYRGIPTPMERRQRRPRRPRCFPVHPAPDMVSGRVFIYLFSRQEDGGGHTAKRDLLLASSKLS